MRVDISPRVKEFIASLDKQTGAKVARMINLLEEFGPRLGMPHARNIDSELKELRVRGQLEVRIFYTFVRGTIYLVHGFIKKTDKTPTREIQTAINRIRGLKLI